MLRSIRFNLRTLFFFTLLVAVDGWLMSLLRPEVESLRDGYLIMGFLCVTLIYLGFVARHIAIVVFERTRVECYGIQPPPEPENSDPLPESGTT